MDDKAFHSNQTVIRREGGGGGGVRQASHKEHGVAMTLPYLRVACQAKEQIVPLPLYSLPAIFWFITSFAQLSCGVQKSWYIKYSLIEKMVK